ncbi:MAG: hypothetical protein ACETWB_03485, partial [Anaerolineae bacterium]
QIGICDLLNSVNKDRSATSQLSALVTPIRGVDLSPVPFILKKLNETAVEVFEKPVYIQDLVGLYLRHLLKLSPFSRGYLGDSWDCLFDYSEDQPVGPTLSTDHSHDPDIVPVIHDLDIFCLVMVLTNSAFDVGDKMFDQKMLDRSLIQAHRYFPFLVPTHP